MDLSTIDWVSIISILFLIVLLIVEVLVIMKLSRMFIRQWKKAKAGE